MGRDQRRPVRVYLEPADWYSRSIHRVAAALRENAPRGVKIVSTREAADLEIVHVVGTGSLPADLGARPYAVVQYCYRSTEKPTPDFWRPIWDRARLVWSYYDLELAERFYHAPLGVDARIFRANAARRRFKIGTSGYVAASESIGECADAARRVGGEHFHLGPDLGFPGLVYRTGVPDAELANLWGSCEYVSGLRRVEGFELPVLEGFACGARPIVFDTPDYRRWFGDFAVLVPELAPAALADELASILAAEPEPIGEAERAAVLERFSWKTLARGFWERCLAQ